MKSLNKIFEIYQKKSLFVSWVILIFWLGFIFWFSEQPGDFLAGPLSLDWVIRKIGHMFVFGLLCLFIFNVLNSTDSSKYKISILVSLIIAICYAGLDEYHQTLSIGRFGKLSDVGIDTLGILISCWLVFLYKNLEPRT